MRRLANLPLVLLLASAAPAAAPLSAQPSDTSAISTEPLFTRRDAVYAGIVTGTSLALFLVDEELNTAVGKRGVQDNDFIRNRAAEFNWVNENRLMLAGGLLWGVGRLTRADDLADIAFHATEAVAVSTVFNTLIRGTLGRARPYIEPDDAFAFSPGKGFSEFGYRAFPSIHASANFSAAAVITSEVRRRWPGATWYVGAASYSLAALPTLSRIYLQRHWVSDIVMGAFVGTLTGLKVVQYHHSHPGNRIDDIFLAMSAAPDGAGGVMLLYSYQF